MRNIRQFVQTTAAVALLAGAAACGATARGVAQDAKANTAATKAGIETLDVKTAILADKTVDAGAINVDTYGDTKTVVLRGSVPTQAQKARAEQIAREHATGYKIDNKLAVVPK